MKRKLNYEEDYRRTVKEFGPSRFLSGTQIEVIREISLSKPPKHVLFDFDGTLSLIREGWPTVMVPMMVEVLQQTGTAESPEILEALVNSFVQKLTGKQTIYQMIRLAEEVQKRGGKPEKPRVYKKRYHELLMKRIRGRREALRSGQVRPETFLVPNSLAFLDFLKSQAIQLYLASGTDVHYVCEEAALLGLDRYFESRIYGAVDNYRSFSKRLVIENILQDNQIDGSRLIGFGDGYVEIENIKSAGGVAVAVASDESGRSGRPDLWKRERLVGIGADLIIPDYQDFKALYCYLWKSD